MKNKKNVIILILVTLLLFLVYGSFQIVRSKQITSQAKTDAVSIRIVSSQILVNGTVTPQNEATLHFQTGGKLVFLPFKQGDQVWEGQTIAQLDTYQLQRQLTQALNTYRTQRDTFDQAQQNNQTGVLQGQQSFILHSQNNLNPSGDTQTNIINDMVKRILDQNQASLDNSVINVELANYALQLSTLTSPLSGIVTHEDVLVPDQNITTTTGFTVADPTSLIFRANVNENDIDFVKEGANASVQINGIASPLSGIVSKIYPDKQVLANGQGVYQVDISVNQLPDLAKIDQAGVASITSSDASSVMLIPTWTILNHQFVWVEENGNPILKHVQMGKEHGNMTEILSGLKQNDRLLINPTVIADQRYQLLNL